MNTKGRAATEVSGIGGITLGITLLVSGSIIPGAVALLVGTGLMLAYEYFGVSGINVSQDQIEEWGETVEDEVDEQR